MKLNKSVLTVAVLSTLSCSAMAATIYATEDTTLKLGGRVEGRGYFAHDEYDDKSRVSINIEGETKVSDNASFYGRYENEIGGADAAGSSAEDSMETRYMQTGFKTNLGNFYYGRHDNATTFMTDWTDLAEVNSGIVNEHDALTADRSEGNLRYELKKGGLTMNLGAVNNEVVEGFAASVGFELDSGFGIAAAYTDSKQDNYGENGDDFAGVNANNRTGMVATKFDIGNLYMAAMYEQGSTDFDSKSSDYIGMDAYIGLNFADTGYSHHNINVTYNYFEHDDRKFSHMDVENIGLEYGYHIKNATIYASYTFNVLEDSDYLLDAKADTEDAVMVGVKYNF
ncbi:porin [Vibrio sp. HN007]|uniref:porin n=1 Tax=Vibrio iocasae TaxID=3098914 RepID=UPI0035D503B7